MAELPEIPPGMMRAWDPKQKQVILVTAPPAGPDTLTFTMRLHDRAEKKDAAKCTSWATVEVARADLKLSQADFLAKYVVPNLGKLTQLEGN